MWEFPDLLVSPVQYYARRGRSSGAHYAMYMPRSALPAAGDTDQAMQVSKDTVAVPVRAAQHVWDRVPRACSLNSLSAQFGRELSGFEIWPHGCSDVVLKEAIIAVDPQEEFIEGVLASGCIPNCSQCPTEGNLFIVGMDFSSLDHEYGVC